MIISVDNVIRVYNPTDELINWCEKNLIFTNPDFNKHKHMGFSTRGIPPKITLFTRDGDDIVLPFGTLQMIPTLMLYSSLFHEGFAAPVKVNYEGNIQLYDYQIAAVDAMAEIGSGILQSKAGSGKTQMGIALIQRFGVRALWLTHTKDLLKQSKDRAERYFKNVQMGTITEGAINIGNGITFATVQTMSKIDLTPYRNYWDCIIIDECHKTAGTPTKLTMFSKVLNSLSARHKIGLSATVHRADGMIKATYTLIGTVVHRVPDEAVADKTMTVGVKPIALTTQLQDEMQNSDGTLNYTNMITCLCTDRNRNKIIAESIEQRPSLILSERLMQLRDIMSMLPDDMRKQACLIHGGMTSLTDKRKREEYIAAMRSGDKKYLFATYSLAKEGLDIPCLERLYLASPQKDYAVITQSIGRIARTADGKDKPVVYDFVDTQIPFLAKAYRKRLSHYKKAGCYLLKEGE